MGWRERDWARFTDDERKALYGGGDSRTEPVPYYRSAPSTVRRRSILAPGAGVAIALTVGLFALGHYPKGHPILPVLNFGGNATAQLPATHHAFPLDLPPNEAYGSTLTASGTDPNAASGAVVATGQWNGGPWTTLASTTLAADHTWSLPISLNQHGTLNVRVSLPSGNSLVGSLTIAP